MIKKVWFLCALGFVAVACTSASTTDDGAPGMTMASLEGRSIVDSQLVPLMDSPTRGNPDAPIAVVAFIGFPCTDCELARETFAELQRERPDEVQYVFKHAPRDDLAQSWMSARMLEAAYNQDSFWEFKAALFDRMEDLRGGTARDIGEEIAEDLGLDMRRFRADLESFDIAGRVERDQELAQRLEVRVNPTFFVNGEALVAPRRARNIHGVIENVDAVVTELRANDLPAADLYERSVSAFRGRHQQQVAERSDEVEVEVLVATMSEVIVEEEDLIYGETEDFLVTLVEFSNSECTFSGDAAATIRELAAVYEDELRLVYKPFPHDMHVHSVEASQAVVAAHQQGQGARMLTRLYDRQDRLGEEGLFEDLAREMDLDMDRFARDMQDSELEERIWASHTAGQALNVASTPEFFINGRRVVGAQPFEHFQRLVEDELIRARGLAEESDMSGEALYLALLADERDADYWRARAEELAAEAEGETEEDTDE